MFSFWIFYQKMYYQTLNFKSNCGFKNPKVGLASSFPSGYPGIELKVTHHCASIERVDSHLNRDRRDNPLFNSEHCTVGQN